MAKVEDNIFRPDDIQPVSKSAEPRHKLEPVTTTTVRKKSVAKKLSDIFISEDLNSVKGYLIYDVIVPAIKDMIVDSITKGIGRLFYSDTRPSGGYSKGGHTSYDSYYGKSTSKYSSSNVNNYNRDRLDISNYLIATRGEAEKVIDGLIETAERYDGEASLSVFYELIGRSDEYTDSDWCWKLQTLRQARIVRVSNGYIIDLPRPVPVEK